MQLAKENRKFIYGIIREGARAKDFELAIQWLLDCGLVHKNIRITKPGMPLISYMDMSAFKLYMLDVGLLGARGDLDAKTILNGSAIFKEFKGALTEQFIAQEFKSYGLDLYYYSAPNALRTSMSNYREQEWLVNVPLYMAGIYITKHFI